MCGIFGFVAWERSLPPVDDLCKATNLLRHRGPDGGAYSSAVDIDRFLRAVWSGELLGQELRDLMHTAHARAGEDHTGQPIHMGYGIFLRSGGAFGHGGGDPGVETLGRMWPAQDLTAVVLCNGGNMLDPAWTAIVSAVP